MHYAYDPESTAAELARLDERVRNDPRLEHIREGLAWFREFAGRAIVDTPAVDTPPGRVLGGEACIWAELVTDELFEGRVWGRLPAIAERLWSPGSLRDEEDMYQRLARTRPVLAAYADIDLGARQAAAFARLGVGAAELAALRPLIDAIEPIKWYARLLGEEALRARVEGSKAVVERPYTVTTPLDRVVDYIDPASEWVQRFGAVVRDVLDGAADADTAFITTAVARMAAPARGGAQDRRTGARRGRTEHDLDAARRTGRRRRRGARASSGAVAPRVARTRVGAGRRTDHRGDTGARRLARDKMIDPVAIAARFALDGAPCRAENHRGGHINETWFVTTDAGRRYVLQRINATVFVEAQGVAATRRGSSHTSRSARRNWYRRWFLHGTATRRSAMAAPRIGCSASSPDVRSAGSRRWRKPPRRGMRSAVFNGRWPATTAVRHVVPIPHFHELAFQLERFDRVLASPVAERMSAAANDVAQAQKERGAVTAESLGPSGMIHGDGKVTNLLFADDDSVNAVLDLDTVMWGALSWDFGDLVRSAAALGDEDDPAIGFSIERYRALTDGYVRGAGDLVDAELRAALGTVPAYMAYMLGLRFLIDYLDGDRYFRVAHAQHNLIRARSQFRLFRLMVDARADMHRIAGRA